MKNLTIANVEAIAEKRNKGSVFRGCLAFQRSCNNSMGDVIISLGFRYVMGQQTLLNIEQICNRFEEDASGEFKEAIFALKNAIEIENS